MKTYLRLSFLMIAIAVFQLANAQVTKLSDNTNLKGFILSNGTPILVSDVDNTLWTSDGTPAGTKKFTTKATREENHYGVVLKNKVYFSGIDANGAELWITDGTDAGTNMVIDIMAGEESSSPDNFFVYNDEVFFFARTPNKGTELWKTNGTSAGTTLVKDINEGTGSSVAALNYFFNNGVAYFVADDGQHGKELWKTDGSEAGTVLVKDINEGAGNSFGGFLGITILNEFVSLGNLTFFVASNGTGDELWKTDGTNNGTVMVRDISSAAGGSLPNNLVVFNNKIFFSASTPEEGFELWSSDGTEAGTNRIKDINPGEESSVPSLFNSIFFGDRMIFTATDATNGAELWSTDGTENGTVLLKDINVGANGSGAFLLPDFRFSNNLTLAGYHLPPFNGKVFIAVTTEDNGTELWITDGTANGTLPVKDINEGDGDGIDGNYFYTANALFFAADNGSTGSELWKTDGTPGGTSIVKDINPGENPSDPEFNFVYNNHLYFTANDGSDEAGTPSLFIVDEAVILPISLYNFAATAQLSKAVKLEWNTTNELNSSHFDIERSADGINFSSIDKINAAGNSSLNQRYQYIDQQPVHLRNPVLYYRLKMVDKDAAFKYSGILAVHFKESKFEFTFSPNPVQNQLSVVIAAAGAKTVALLITDATGRQVYQQSLSAAQTVNQQNINVATWQKGIYYIQLITDNATKTSKFIKQ